MRNAEHIEDVALVRVEQLYPFPEQEIRAVLSKYRQVQTVAWVQEEPRNRGAFHFVERRLRNMVRADLTLQYFGRDESASPATGWQKMHEVEEQEFLTQALDIPSRRAIIVAKADEPDRAELAQATTSAAAPSKGNTPR
jgi:2-oxoglutarate dehydrogenase E1 component